MSTKQSFIKLYPDNRRTPSIFDVAGQECDSIVECPFRGVGEEGECHTDKLKASCFGFNVYSNWPKMQGDPSSHSLAFNVKWLW